MRLSKHHNYILTTARALESGHMYGFFLATREGICVCVCVDGLVMSTCYTSSLCILVTTKLYGHVE